MLAILEMMLGPIISGLVAIAQSKLGSAQPSSETAWVQGFLNEFMPFINKFIPSELQVPAQELEQLVAQIVEAELSKL